jgi:hypothetical protein
MDIKELLDNEGIDLVSQIKWLMDVRTRCKEGITQERTGSPGIVLQVTEKYPNAEIAATKAIVDILRYVEDIANGGNKDVVVKLEVVPLEVNPDLSEASFYDEELM